MHAEARLADHPAPVAHRSRRVLDRLPARRDEPALAGPVPDQRRRRQHAGVPQGLRVPRRAAPEARARLPDLVAEEAARIPLPPHPARVPLGASRRGGGAPPARDRRVVAERPRVLRTGVSPPGSAPHPGGDRGGPRRGAARTRRPRAVDHHRERGVRARAIRRGRAGVRPRRGNRSRSRTGALQPGSAVSPPSSCRPRGRRRCRPRRCGWPESASVVESPYRVGADGLVEMACSRSGAGESCLPATLQSALLSFAS